MDEWRDISSAPKDGSYVLLWDHDVNHPEIGRWYVGGDCWINQNWWGVDDEALKGEDLIGYTIYIPTHWQPLPASPSPAEIEE